MIRHEGSSRSLLRVQYGVAVAVAVAVVVPLLLPLSAPRPTLAIVVSGLLLRPFVAPDVLDGDVVDVGEVEPESSSLLS